MPEAYQAFIIYRLIKEQNILCINNDILMIILNIFFFFKVVDIFSLKSCAQCSNPVWERVLFSSVTIS